MSKTYRLFFATDSDLRSKIHSVSKGIFARRERKLARRVCIQDMQTYFAELRDAVRQTEIDARDTEDTNFLCWLYKQEILQAEAEREAQERYEREMDDYYESCWDSNS